MILDNGYIRIYRGILKWEWYDDANTFRLFTHLLLTVNWEDANWHGKTIKRGQRVTSVAKLSEELGISTKSVRVALEHLKATGEVAIETSNRWTLVTVANYERYQTEQQKRASETASHTANKGQTKGKQRATNEKEKEEQKEKEIKNTSMHSIIEAWNELEDFGIVKIVSLTPGTKRYEMTQARVKQYGEEEVIRAIRKAKNSKFLQGSTFFTYDWFIAPNNFIKVLEGNYDNKGEAKAEPTKEIFPEEDYNPNIKRW